MKKYIEYLHQSAKSIEQDYQTFQSPPYEEWKQNNYLLWSQTTFRPLLLLSLIIILVRLSLLANQKEIQITMAILSTLNIMIYFIQPYVNTKKNYLIQFLPFIQQQTVSWFCIVLTNQDTSYQILFAMVSLSSLSLYYSVLYKLIAIITYVLQIEFFTNLNQNEGLYLSILIMLIHLIRKEFQEMHYFKKLEALFSIIDSIPHAMCIVHKNKDFLLYSNKYFENLSSRLHGLNNSETESSPEKLINYSAPQLKFLQNLQLNEFTQPSCQVLDFYGEGQFDDDTLKIKKVIYGKANNPVNPQELHNCPPSKQTMQQQQFFKSLKNPNEIQRKTYTSDVTIQVELKYQPQNQQVSAQFKSHRKQSSNFQIQAHRKVSCEQLIQQKNSLLDSLQQSPQHVKSSTTTLDQKMKFLVHVMENNKLFDKEQDLQIYFIHDMQPVMLKNKLEKLESQKKNLLRSISHELLTNLNAAYGFIKQSQDKVKRKENCSIELEYSYRYIKLQLFKIYDIFDYRDILDGKLVMKKDKFDIQGVINECVDLVRDQYEKKLLLMEVEIPENNYQIIGDRQRLCQVILNLIGNAIKFTYQGKISIIVKRKQLMNSMPNILDDEINSSEGDANNLIEIYVKDTGIGMSEKELSILQKKLHIFDEDEKVSQESVGIGLGLSVCKSIISLMTQNKNYGVLQVGSVKNEGSDFFFSLAYNDERSQHSIVRKSNNLTIPLMDAQSSTQQVKVMNYNKRQLQISDRLGMSQLQIEIPPPNQCQCKRLLIVDDEQFNIEVLKHLTKQMGYDSDSALNGKIALQLIKNKLDCQKCTQFCQGYHAILMDINMPIMGGWETVQRLRQMECELRLTKTIPVIAVTAFCSIQDQEQCIKEGFNSVIVKPATFERLDEVFNDLNL